MIGQWLAVVPSSSTMEPNKGVFGAWLADRPKPSHSLLQYQCLYQMWHLIQGRQQKVKANFIQGRQQRSCDVLHTLHCDALLPRTGWSVGGSRKIASRDWYSSTQSLH